MIMSRLVLPAFVVLIVASLVIVFTSVARAKASSTSAFHLPPPTTEISPTPDDFNATNATGTEAWFGVVTCPSQGRLLEQTVPSDPSQAQGEWLEDRPKLQLEPDFVYQPIRGFGFSLTGGSAQHLMGMSPESRATLLQELFVTRNFNTLRISIGASDLEEIPFSYSDGPGQFSIEKDYQHLIPLLKEILAIQPGLVLIATPWSAPAWMKDNQSTVGGHLKPEHYQAYASYLVNYLTAYQQEGIYIRKMTLQNEPMNYSNNPSMIMTIDEQATFLRDYLAPTLVMAGMAEWKDNVFSTPLQILIFEHNPDYIEYPLTLLNDTTIHSIVEGSAYHLYAGEVTALSQVHDAFPTKSIHITEQWVSAQGDHEDDILWHGRNVLIGGLSNYAQTILGWNLSSNKALTPYTDGGCSTCLGALTIDETIGVKRNTAYYLLAHAAPFLPPGSVRIESKLMGLLYDEDGNGPLHHAAFLTPTQQQVILFTNEGTTDCTIDLPNESQVKLLAGSLMTIVLDSPPTLW